MFKPLEYLAYGFEVPARIRESKLESSRPSRVRACSIYLNAPGVRACAVRAGVGDLEVKWKRVRSGPWSRGEESVHGERNKRAWDAAVKATRRMRLRIC